LSHICISSNIFTSSIGRTTLKLQPIVSASNRVNSQPNDFSIVNFHQVVRQYTYEGLYYVIESGNQNEGILDAYKIKELVKCNINLISPDLLTEDRLESFIWSFGKNQLQIDNACVVIRKEDGRWFNEKCDQKLKSACFNGSSIVFGTRDTFSKTICPKNYMFRAPTSGYENEMLKQKLSTQKVWIFTNLK